MIPFIKEFDGLIDYDMMFEKGFPTNALDNMTAPLVITYIKKLKNWMIGDEQIKLS